MPYEAWFDEAGKTHNVDPALLRAMAQVESGYDPNAVSPVGAEGLMQIMPATAKSLGVDPRDPKQAIHGAAKLMRENLDRYGNPEEAVLAYHGGTNKANWGPKTHGYLEKVVKFFVKPAGAADKPPPQEQWSTGFLRSIEDAPAQPQRATSTPVPTPSDAPWSAGFLKSIEDVQAAKAAPAPTAPSTLENVAAGAVRGVRDMLDPLYGWLAENYGTPDRQRQAQETMRRDLAEYEAGAGKTFAGGAGRVGAQVAATAPIIGAVELAAAPILGGIGRGAAALGRAAEGTTLDNMLTRAFTQGIQASSGALRGIVRGSAGEDAGALLRGAARVLHGAEQGAAANALTSGANPDVPWTHQALTGAALGAGATGAVGALGALAPYGRSMLERVTAGGPAANALQDVRAALGGRTPQSVADELRAMGPEARLADVPLETIQRLGNAVATGGGPGANVAREALETRQAGAGERILGAVRDAFGVEKGKAQTIDDLMAQRAEAAAPLYRQAWAHELSPTPEQLKRLDRYLADPDFQKAAKEGVDIARLEALRTGEDVGQMSPMRLLDYIKRGIDTELEKAKNPITGKYEMTPKQRALSAAKSDYLSLLDEMNPFYAEARAAYAGPSQIVDLLEQGSKLATKNPDIAESVIAKMTPEDRQIMAQGFADALIRKLEAGGDDADHARRIFKDKASRRRIEAMIGDPERFNQFEKRMQDEMRMHETFRETLRGSKTGKVLSAQAEHGLDPGVIVDTANALGNLAVGNLGSAGAYGTAAARRLLGGPTPERNARLAELLYTDAGVNALQQLARPVSPVDAAIRRAGNVLINPGFMSLVGSEGVGR